MVTGSDAEGIHVPLNLTPKMNHVVTWAIGYSGLNGLPAQRHVSEEIGEETGSIHAVCFYSKMRFKNDLNFGALGN